MPAGRGGAVELGACGPTKSWGLMYVKETQQRYYENA